MTSVTNWNKSLRSMKENRGNVIAIIPVKHIASFRPIQGSTERSLVVANYKVLVDNGGGYPEMLSCLDDSCLCEGFGNEYGFAHDIETGDTFRPVDCAIGLDDVEEHLGCTDGDYLENLERLLRAIKETGHPYTKELEKWFKVIE